MTPAEKQAEPVWRRRLRLLVFLVGLPVLGLALLLSYGDLSLFLGCIGCSVTLALLTWRVMRGFSLSMTLLVACAACVWGIDSSMQYPVLRWLQSAVPFGPSISVAQSPSGETTAYIYNHGFLDSSYAVHFARGRSFPGEANWIRYDQAADFTITAVWIKDIFRVEVDGGPVVLTYSEATHRLMPLK